MKRLAVLSTLWAMTAIAEPRSIPRVGALAEGCVVTTIPGNPCGSVTAGRLAAGDCTTDSGKYLDAFEFTAGPGVGPVVTPTIRPLTSAYTNPSIFLVRRPGTPQNHRLSSEASMRNSGMK